MPNISKRVLIIEHDHDLAYLMQAMLLQEEYDASWMIQSLQSFEEIRQRAPDLVVIDLLPTQMHEEVQLLDRLRIDPATGGIPILAIATSEQRAEQAMTSFNVREFVVKPFDLDNFLEKVRRALAHPPLHAEIAPGTIPSAVRAEAERILVEHSREALFRWVQRLRERPQWQGRGDAAQFSVVLEDTPILVEVVDATLHFGSPQEYFQRHPEALERIRTHPRVRKQQGISLADVVREYTLLRNELWALLARHLSRQLTGSEVLELQRAIDGALDQIIEVIVPAYEEADNQAA